MRKGGFHMFDNRSLFGYVNDNPAMRNAYDMMVLDQIEKDDKELALQKMYGDQAKAEELADEPF